MEFLVEKILPGYHFTITGASYAGAPRNGTMMYITAKVGCLIHHLEGHKNCVCFVEKGVEVPEQVRKDNAVIFSDNPAYAYASFAAKVNSSIQLDERKRGYTRQEGGYYIGDNVKIGKNAYIEPNVLIGHDVVIGDHAVIMSGSVLKHAIIGDYFLCNENAAIGDFSFTITTDDEGNKFRIPSMGRVVIGNHVEVGACDDIAMGVCGDTILDDYVKLDGLVHIGHETHLHRNTEITAGAIVAGFVDMGENTYLGVNSCIRNRISLGSNCIIGMGAVATKAVEEGTTVAGNPARKLNARSL